MFASVINEGLNGVVALQLSAKVLALLRLSINFFELQLTKKLENNLELNTRSNRSLGECVRYVC